MAREFSEAMKVPELEPPMQCFLTEAEAVKGLGAVALAARAEEDGRTVTVYAFVDIAAAKAGDEEARDAVRALDTAHTAFSRAVRASKVPVLTDLWYVPATKKTLVANVHRFADKLLDGPGSAIQPMPLPINTEQVAVAAFAEIRRR